MFVFGMAGIVVTAIPITLIKFNYPLLLITVFSGYLALAGWRNRCSGPAFFQVNRIKGYPLDSTGHNM
jgi:hypothetical protein